MSHFSEEDRSIIIRMNQGGHSDSYIARVNNWSRVAVFYQRNALGLPRRHKQGRKYRVDETEQRIIELFTNGTKLAVMALKLKLSVGVVAYRIRRLGLKRQPLGKDGKEVE